MPTNSIITIATDDAKPITEMIYALRTVETRCFILDDCTIEGPTDFEWDITPADFGWEDDAIQPNLPLSPEDARKLMDDKGNIQVTVQIEKGEYLDLVAHSRFTGSDLSPARAAHDLALSFGDPEDDDHEIIGVTRDSFIVNYMTKIDEQLAELGA